ncbi:MAG TPA: hypothetical protein VFS20_09900 [Longimicrobium sp.]|nr:hypothetical protein [Longimicrobium sp.]
MTMPGRITTVFVAFLALMAFPAAGHTQARELMGARVRVTAPPVRADKVTGEVTQYDSAGLVVRDEVTGTEQAFPLRSIRLLEISQGNTRGGSAWHRARLLAFITGSVGAIAGAALRPFGNAGKSIGIAGGAGLLLGGSIGAAWGSSAPRERWEWAPRPFGYDPNFRMPPPPLAPAPTPAPAAPDSVPTAQP